MHHVIGIAGPSRVGKDTVARMIVQYLPQYQIVSLADPIKAMLAEGLGLTDEQLNGNDKEKFDPRYNCTPRHMMQTLGTEWGRDLVHAGVWLQAFKERINRPTVVPDVRFGDEADFVRCNGLLVHVEGEGGPETGHVSETPLQIRSGDKLIINNAGLGDLEGNVYRLLQSAGLMARYGCEAVQYSDQMQCARCGLAWDVNDPDRPMCKRRRNRT